MGSQKMPFQLLTADWQCPNSDSTWRVCNGARRTRPQTIVSTLSVTQHRINKEVTFGALPATRKGVVAPHVIPEYIALIVYGGKLATVHDTPFPQDSLMPNEYVIPQRKRPSADVKTWVSLRGIVNKGVVPDYNFRSQPDGSTDTA